MSKLNPRPTGETGGADIPVRGVRTGVTDTYGSNLEQGYDNPSKITGDTKSDMGEYEKSHCPNIKG